MSKHRQRRPSKETDHQPYPNWLLLVFLTIICAVVVLIRLNFIHMPFEEVLRHSISFAVFSRHISRLLVLQSLLPLTNASFSVVRGFSLLYANVFFGEKDVTWHCVTHCCDRVCFHIGSKY